jgi:dTDP-3-amino-3,4,6-trideoxy-alpha-D-glucose transaminase
MTRRVVPLDDLERLYAEQADEIRSAVEEVLASGRYTFTKGKEVESFERAFADYIGTADCVGVSSGTAALWLALDALGIGPGDEVIVPANTYVASVFVISYLGATPVLADVGEATFTLDPAVVETLITPRTAALLPVHLFGAPCDMDALSRIAASAGLAVVEDAAQAHGATLHGKRVGTFGAAGCFSFYPTKNLGAWGDGGAVVTAVPELAERVRLLRAHGEKPRYQHRMVGTTARLDALQAAVLRRKLIRLDAWNDERRRLGAALRERLLDGLGEDGQSSQAIELTNAPFPQADHVYHLFVVRSDRRDELREHLSARGVGSAVHYPTPIHLTEAYADLGLAPGSLPVSERMAQRMCSLPLFPGMSDAELERVSEAVLDFAQDRAPQAR